MIITILGSGTCVFSLERASSSILLESEKANLLLDAGTGCSRRLLEKDFDIAMLDGIYFSHFHPDHSSELVPILFSLKYGQAVKSKKSFYLMGGPGFKKFFKKLQNVYGHWIDLDERIEIIEFGENHGSKFEFYDINLETFSVNHRPESIALRVWDKRGKNFVYSGDMDITEGFEFFIENCNLLIIESAMPDNAKVDGHLTPSLAAEIALKGNAEKLILTHFYPQCTTNDFLKEAEKIFNNKITLAYDLMEIKL